MMEGKHLKFVEHEPKPKTKVWGVYNKHSNELLGEILWHPPYRQYCFDDGVLVLAKSCMDDMSKFIEEHWAERVHLTNESQVIE